MKLYPGNESEKPVIRQVIKELKERNQISSRTVQVADKGFNCANNIISALKNNSVVIGDPPWISFGLRGVGVLDESLESYLRSNFPNSAEYKLSLYAVFMEAAINLLE